MRQERGEGQGELAEASGGGGEGAWERLKDMAMAAIKKETKQKSVTKIKYKHTHTHARTPAHPSSPSFSSPSPLLADTTCPGGCASTATTKNALGMHKKRVKRQPNYFLTNSRVATPSAEQSSAFSLLSSLLTPWGHMQVATWCCLNWCCLCLDWCCFLLLLISLSCA